MTTASRIVILVLVFGSLVLPLFAMLEFATRGDYGSRSLASFQAILDYPDVVGGITTSLQIAVLTVKTLDGEAIDWTVFDSPLGKVLLALDPPDKADSAPLRRLAAAPTAL